MYLNVLEARVCLDEYVAKGMIEGYSIETAEDGTLSIMIRPIKVTDTLTLSTEYNLD
jgi:hypothetical protein